MYKQKKNNNKKFGLIFIIATIVIILGIKFQTISVYADITTQIECNPEVVRICSICGNDYDDGNVCSHHIDEMYNGTVCEPEGGQICTICNGNYATCSHHAGDSYGGEVCTTYERCNICGNDYHDGSVCSHHKGKAYGGQVCEVYLTTMCNICGNDYNDLDVCTHHVGGYYYDYDDVCEPYDIDRCNICGNDYNDAEACHHYIGEVYNEVVCTTTNICSICGNDYYGIACSHYQGETYGSTECEAEAGRICNICNNNYDDGSVCSHYENVMYNGEICSTYDIRTCNICGNNYDDGNVCPHHIGERYENVVYVFYIDEFAKEAENEAQRMAIYYHLGINSMIMVEIDSLENYVEEWNDIGNVDGELCNVLAVTIHVHGNPYSQGTGDDSSYDWYINIYDINNKFQNKKVGEVILISCNVGDVDIRNNNIAAYIAKKVYGAPVKASDGTVTYYRVSAPSLTEIHYNSENDKYFKKALGEPLKTRDNLGWLIYRYVDNSIYVSESYGKDLTFNQLLTIGN